MVGLSDLIGQHRIEFIDSGALADRHRSLAEISRGSGSVDVLGESRAECSGGRRELLAERIGSGREHACRSGGGVDVEAIGDMARLRTSLGIKFAVREGQGEIVFSIVSPAFIIGKRTHCHGQFVIILGGRRRTRILGDGEFTVRRHSGIGHREFCRP